jgi:hypothetical protein
MGKTRFEADTVAALSREAEQAWRVQVERTRAGLRELRDAKIKLDDPQMVAKLQACEDAVEALIAAVEDWPEELTMSALLRQGAKLSLAKAGMLDALQALCVDLPPERNELHLKLSVGSRNSASPRA